MIEQKIEGDLKMFTQVDPLGKPKKKALFILVAGMVVAMVFVFAAFHWLYTEYFNFAANKAERHQELANIKKMCAELERTSKERRLAVEAEFSQRQASNEKNFVKRSKEIDEELSRKKQDFATLMRGIEDRFHTKTNELASAIHLQNTELQRLIKEKESLADMSRQYESISNALARAIDERDKAMRLARSPKMIPAAAPTTNPVKTSPR
jgi:hypothetical protein